MKIRAFIFLIFTVSCIPGGCRGEISGGGGLMERVIESFIEQQFGVKMDIMNTQLPEDKRDLVPPGFEVGMYGETGNAIAIGGKIKMSPDGVKDYYINKFGKPTGELSIWVGTRTLFWDNIGLTLIIRESGGISQLWIVKVAIGSQL